MSWISTLLKRLKIIAQFSEDDVINASTEDALREHTSLIEQVREVTKKRVQGNRALRASITSAKHRTNSFADLEKLISGQGDIRK